MKQQMKKITWIVLVLSLFLLAVACKPMQQNNVSSEQIKAEMAKLPSEKINQIASEKTNSDKQPIAGQAYAIDKTVTIGRYKIPLAQAIIIAQELQQERKTEAHATVTEEKVPTTPSPPPTPTVKAGECLKITLLPYDPKAEVQSKINRKVVCESVSCKFGDPQTAAPFNPEDDVCFGDKLIGCPKVSLYAFEGANFQKGRENLCKSVLGCVYKQGKTASQDTCMKQ